MKIIKQVITVLALAGSQTLSAQDFFSLCKSDSVDFDMTLKYSKPASQWVEALPLGNGRMGAMVYGGIQHEEVQLNEATFWSGRPHNNDNPKARGVLDSSRQLIFDGKLQEAEKLIGENFFSGIHGQRYLPVGSVVLDFYGLADSVSDYKRSLYLPQAVSLTSFVSDGVEFSRAVFVSLADDVVAICLKASKPGALSFEAGFQSPCQNSVSAKKDILVMDCLGQDHEGIAAGLRAETVMKAFSDGKVSLSPSKLSISGASYATILVTSATNFVNYHDISADEKKRANEILRKASAKSLDALMKAHAEKFSAQFQGVRLSLQSKSQAQRSADTDCRVRNFSNGKDESLAALMFHYGRYLLISSSQKGGQPANLQGIWNHQTWAPWDSKYTININAEMNYWPAEVMGLAENAEPFFRMVDELSHTGSKTAADMYGCHGWVAHHNTDIWRIAGPVDGVPWGMFPTGGAWLTTHLWEHYLYTLDVDFLKRYYPVMKGAADFLLDFMVDDKSTGYRVITPSVSPEHGPMGNPSNLTYGSTMDRQIVFDVLSQTLKASEILGYDADYQRQLKECIAKLPPMQIGKYGQLQEWLADADDPSDEHRHVSHLYGLYPSAQISPYATPQLFNAAKTTLLQRGDEATGWSIGWKINLWARLLDGNHAYKIIQNLLKLIPKDEGFRPSDGRTYPNLFDAHPPFQIDGNFGYTAGVCEMLMQSYDGFVTLLPALPDSWPGGSVEGLRARGGYVVDISWFAGQISVSKITATHNGTLKLRSAVPLAGSKTLRSTVSSFRLYEYEVEMQQGETIELKKM